MIYLKNQTLFSTQLQSASVGEVFLVSLVSIVNSIREFVSTDTSTLYAVYGMVIFSEVLLFFGFIWAYLHARWGNILIDTPLNLVPFLYITSTLNTASSIISYIIYKNTVSEHSDSERLLSLATLIAVMFLSYQGDEYSFLQCGLNHNWFVTYFLIITGLHSMHVCVGIVFILFSIHYHENEGSNKVEDFNIGTYWHFVELIWVALTFLLFLM
uniref:Cytochrome c oxidase subunit 3 n=1 Tax=Babesia sp. Dunhuang TaxID=1164853 RepID=A0A5P8T188_9APIC|nr:cytochrome oxidase subunit III [Babesia sp. Xinjiang]QFS00163.1 cytochrome oxidase subunit III [Babesia sp. Xinjiang]QFS00166.1 cytochrome oxidase subunit III [Babesia sp. Dunhuang]